MVASSSIACWTFFFFFCRIPTPVMPLARPMPHHSFQPPGQLRRLKDKDLGPLGTWGTDLLITQLQLIHLLIHLLNQLNLHNLFLTQVIIFTIPDFILQMFQICINDSPFAGKHTIIFRIPDFLLQMSQMSRYDSSFAAMFAHHFKLQNWEGILCALIMIAVITYQC